MTLLAIGIFAVGLIVGVAIGIPVGMWLYKERELLLFRIRKEQVGD